MKTLVCYFSAESGTTAGIARALAETLGADIYEIQPEKPYTAEDLKWTNPLARCNKEKFGNKDVPVNGKVENFAEYGRVFIGFPIWYGVAPNVVNTFCAGYDWSGKSVALFATSGGSGIGKTAEKLQPYIKGATISKAKLFRGTSDLKGWAESIG